MQPLRPKLIPAGTGLKKYNDILLKTQEPAAEEEEETATSEEQEEVQA